AEWLTALTERGVRSHLFRERGKCSKRAYVVDPEVTLFQHSKEEPESTPNLDAPHTLMRISRNMGRMG
ncbi:hypothetical protein ACHAPQ_000792, partial [Fusarium lateritium]